MTMTFIATATNTTGTGNFSFTSIPQTFTHLQLRVFGRNASTGNQPTWTNFNGDYGATSYAWHRLLGDGSAVGATGFTSQNVMITGFTVGTTVSTSIYQNCIVDILDYTNTNKNKVVRSIYGVNANDTVTSNQQVGITSGLWLSTAAITRVDAGIIGDNFGIGSRVDLYGITTSTVTGA